MNGSGNAFGSSIPGLPGIDEVFLDNIGTHGQNANGGQNNFNTNSGYTGSNFSQPSAPQCPHNGIHNYNAEEQHAAHTLRSMQAGSRGLFDLNNSIRALTERVGILEEETLQLKSVQRRHAQDEALLKGRVETLCGQVLSLKESMGQNLKACNMNDQQLLAEFDRHYAAISGMINVIMEQNPQYAHELVAEFTYFQELEY